jgi:glycyl-tRNA synthetase
MGYEERGTAIHGPGAVGFLDLAAIFLETRMSDASSNQSATPAKSMDAIMSLCKRRGFIYQASEIYGGLNGFWDYGPLGALLKRNLREAWIQDVVMEPCWGRNGPDGRPVSMVMVDTRLIQHPKVWEASGHVAGFNDPMVD